MFDLEKLKEFMNAKRWSEVQLARELNLDYSYVYRVMRGERGVGKKFYENLFRLCQREGLLLSYFIKEEPDEEE